MRDRISSFWWWWWWRVWELRFRLADLFYGESIEDTFVGISVFNYEMGYQDGLRAATGGTYLPERKDLLSGERLPQAPGPPPPDADSPSRRDYREPFHYGEVR